MEVNQTSSTCSCSLESNEIIEPTMEIKQISLTSCSSSESNEMIELRMEKKQINSIGSISLESNEIIEPTMEIKQTSSSDSSSLESNEMIEPTMEIKQTSSTGSSSLESNEIIEPPSANLLLKEMETLKKQNDKLRYDLVAAKNCISRYESTIVKFQEKESSLEISLQNEHSATTELQLKNEELCNQIIQMNCDIINEKLMCVGLENTIQHLHGSIAFKDMELEIYKKEREDNGDEIQSNYYLNKIAEISASTKEAVEELKEEFVCKISDNRKAIENLYKQKCQNLVNVANDNMNWAKHSADELYKLKISNKNLIQLKVEHENTILKLKEQISLLKKENDRIRAASTKENEKLVADLNQIKRALAELVHEYETNMVITTKVDKERNESNELPKVAETKSNHLNLSAEPFESHLKRSNAFANNVEEYGIHLSTQQSFMEERPSSKRQRIKIETEEIVDTSAEMADTKSQGAISLTSYTKPHKKCFWSWLKK